MYKKFVVGGIIRSYQGLFKNYMIEVNVRGCSNITQLNLVQKAEDSGWNLSILLGDP